MSCTWPLCGTRMPISVALGTWGLPHWPLWIVLVVVLGILKTPRLVLVGWLGCHRWKSLRFKQTNIHDIIKLNKSKRCCSACNPLLHSVQIQTLRRLPASQFSGFTVLEDLLAKDNEAPIPKAPSSFKPMWLVVISGVTIHENYDILGHSARSCSLYLMEAFAKTIKFTHLARDIVFETVWAC